MPLTPASGRPTTRQADLHQLVGGHRSDGRAVGTQAQSCGGAGAGSTTRTRRGRRHLLASRGRACWPHPLCVREPRTLPVANLSPFATPFRVSQAAGGLRRGLLAEPVRHLRSMVARPAKPLRHTRPRIPHYDDPVAVGKRIFDAREAAGLSQRELAFPGCTAAYISRVERGERVPSLQVLCEIARRTGTSEHMLAFGRERLALDVALRLRAAEAAEATGDADARSAAYKALARAAMNASQRLAS
jgi:transcriptional regulator with XRE-family HTH domain